MPFDLRRPQVPDLSDWNDAMDAHLAGRIESGRRPRLAPTPGSLVRWGRGVIRPLGGLAAASALAIFIGVSIPTPSSTPRPVQPTSPEATTVTSVTPETAAAITVREEPPHIPLLPFDSSRMSPDIPDVEPQSGDGPESRGDEVPAPRRQGPRRVVDGPTVY